MPSMPEVSLVTYENYFPVLAWAQDRKVRPERYATAWVSFQNAVSGG